LEPHFATDESFGRLRSLFLTIGGSMIGATAVAFSLVMFAMQVNVERLPHGLFRKFSSDRKLLGAFGLTFLLAITVAILSLSPEISWLAVTVLAAGWGTILILILLLYAYRRALTLINPARQLGLVVEDAHREMEVWVRRARRASPLLHNDADPQFAPAPAQTPTHDLVRVVYFQSYPHWADGARRAITYANAFARRRAEQGDHDISGMALNAIVSINAGYIRAKGKTFFAHYLMSDNPFATDGFINYTLEQLRQNIQIGISRGDEQQIEQTLGALAALTELYLGIDYSDERAAKTHAQIATGYLSTAVQDVLPHNMADVLMGGIRLMGHLAQYFLRHARTDETATLIEKIALIASAGVIKEDYRPVTLVGMEMLADLTFDLILVTENDTSLASGELKKGISLVANTFLLLPDTPLQNIHRTYLAPYYSITGRQTLAAKLTNLTNALAEKGADNEAAKTVVKNIEQWAERLYGTEKNVFLATIEKNTTFTFDIIHWVAHMTKLLLAISNVPACDDRTRDELQKHALSLISILSSVPDDEGAVRHVENFSMTEMLFDVALDTIDRNAAYLSTTVSNLLLSWAFKAGKYNTGQAILTRSVYAIATLCVIRGYDKECSRLCAAIAERLGKGGVPDREARDHAAREIRERAITLDYEHSRWSRIDNAMAETDHETMRMVLNNIANVLSPDTANESIDP
jgi:hypothetical protein